MITRELKLKPTKSQIQKLDFWLIQCQAIYNFGIRKIELNAQDKIYFSKFDFANLLSKHGKKIDIPSHTIQGVLNQSFLAWQRCFKKIGGKPKLKSIRNKMRSIPFPDPIPESRVTEKTIRIPGLGKLRFHKQSLPEGKIKNGRIVKRASGWYLQLTIDTKHVFKIKETDSKVGVDTGFKYLAILSDGTKIENQRYLIKSQKRLAQAQRGKDKNLAARLHEHIKNQRKDYNHKISKKLIKDHSEIYVTNDNLVGQANRFGKSVGDAGIAQLRNFILYKGDNHGRKVKLVDSKYTTMTCSDCRALTGPTGLSKLDVRFWECAACGAAHDRDINAAMNILKAGAGSALVNPKTLDKI